MTLLFVHATAGGEVFRRLLESDYREPVRALLGTPQDARVIDMRYNTNNMVVYAKGPLLLDRVASQMGYDRWIAFMRRFTLHGGIDRDLPTTGSSTCSRTRIRRQRGNWIRWSAPTERVTDQAVPLFRRCTEVRTIRTPVWMAVPGCTRTANRRYRTGRSEGRCAGYRRPLVPEAPDSVPRS